MKQIVHPNRLRVVLAEKCITNRWLAEQLNVTEMTVSRWSTNKIQPSISHKKLLRVEKIGGYASLTPKGIERMHKTCKKYGDSLNIKGNKIVIETEKDLDIALRALADYYKLGVISKKAYGTFSGRELTDISKD